MAPKRPTTTLHSFEDLGRHMPHIPNGGSESETTKSASIDALLRTVEGKNEILSQIVSLDREFRKFCSRHRDILNIPTDMAEKDFFTVLLKLETEGKLTGVWDFCKNRNEIGKELANVTDGDDSESVKIRDNGVVKYSSLVASAEKVHESLLKYIKEVNDAKPREVTVEAPIEPVVVTEEKVVTPPDVAVESTPDEMTHRIIEGHFAKDSKENKEISEVIMKKGLTLAAFREDVAEYKTYCNDRRALRALWFRIKRNEFSQKNIDKLNALEKKIEDDRERVLKILAEIPVKAEKVRSDTPLHETAKVSESEKTPSKADTKETSDEWHKNAMERLNGINSQVESAVKPINTLHVLEKVPEYFEYKDDYKVVLNMFFGDTDFSDASNKKHIDNALQELEKLGKVVLSKIDTTPDATTAPVSADTTASVAVPPVPEGVPSPEYVPPTTVKTFTFTGSPRPSSVPAGKTVNATVMPLDKAPNQVMYSSFSEKRKLATSLKEELYGKDGVGGKEKEFYDTLKTQGKWDQAKMKAGQFVTGKWGNFFGMSAPALPAELRMLKEKWQRAEQEYGVTLERGLEQRAARHVYRGMVSSQEGLDKRVGYIGGSARRFVEASTAREYENQLGYLGAKREGLIASIIGAKKIGEKFQKLPRSAKIALGGVAVVGTGIGAFAGGGPILAALGVAAGARYVVKKGVDVGWKNTISKMRVNRLEETKNDVRKNTVLSIDERREAFRNRYAPVAHDTFQREATSKLAGRAALFAAGGGAGILHHAGYFGGTVPMPDVSNIGGQIYEPGGSMPEISQDNVGSSVYPGALQPSVEGGQIYEPSGHTIPVLQPSPNVTYPYVENVQPKIGGEPIFEPGGQTDVSQMNVGSSVYPGALQSSVPSGQIYEPGNVPEISAIKPIPPVGSHFNDAGQRIGEDQYKYNDVLIPKERIAVSPEIGKIVESGKETYAQLPQEEFGPRIDSIPSEVIPEPMIPQFKDYVALVGDTPGDRTLWNKIEEFLEERYPDLNTGSREEITKYAVDRYLNVKNNPDDIVAMGLAGSNGPNYVVQPGQEIPFTQKFMGFLDEASERVRAGNGKIEVNADGTFKDIIPLAIPDDTDEITVVPEGVPDELNDTGDGDVVAPSDIQESPDEIIPLPHAEIAQADILATKAQHVLAVQGRDMKPNGFFNVMSHENPYVVLSKQPMSELYAMAETLPNARVSLADQMNIDVQGLNAWLKEVTRLKDLYPTTNPAMTLAEYEEYAAKESLMHTA